MLDGLRPIPIDRKGYCKHNEVQPKVQPLQDWRRNDHHEHSLHQ